MIPSTFEYTAPASLADALGVIQDAGDDAKVLAGGHSLIPLMKLRLASPSLVIDLGRITALRYIKESNDFLEIGAMTRYVDLQASQAVQRAAPMLSQASGLVGDTQVRNRGTLGGALAHADPAGDMPAVILALNGIVDIASAKSTRSIHASDFFRDIFETSLEPDEIITAVRIPVNGTGAQHYEKFRRRLCDWAIVGVAVALNLDQASNISSARIALTNVGPTPMSATGAEQKLRGVECSPERLHEAALRAADDIEPTAELNAPTEYKKHIACVMTERALSQAISNVAAKSRD